jgi:hypothetical protein
LLLPAGTDSHSEIMMAATLGKPTIVCACDGAVQRELCHCAFGTFVNGVDELFSVLDRVVGDSSPKE